MATPFTKDEVYELNEWFREKRGSYEKWLKQRKADRGVKEEISTDYGVDRRDPKKRRDSE